MGSLLATVLVGNGLPDALAVSDHVIINEVELNPVMVDRGHEWVELYNPANYSVSLYGWKLTTTKGKKLMLIGKLDPEQYKSFYSLAHEPWLDNEGIQVILWDSKGNQVDITPLLSDTEDSSRTWQRYPDGTDSWEFRAATVRRSNGGEQVPERILFLICGLLTFLKLKFRHFPPTFGVDPGGGEP